MSILNLIKEKYSHLTKKEKIVAQFIVDNPQEALSISVQELAQKCSVSPSTIVKFSKTLGFEGIKDMKIHLARDITTLTSELLEEEKFKSEPEVFSYLKEITIESIEEAYKNLNYSCIKKTAEVLLHAEGVDIYAFGFDYIAGHDLYMKLKQLGIRANIYLNPVFQSLSAINLTPEDVAICISQSGSTKDTIDSIKFAKQNGATTIAITTEGSPLSREADITVYTYFYKTILPEGTIVSRNVELFIIDLIFLELSLLDKKRFKKAYEKFNEVLKTKMLEKW